MQKLKIMKLELQQTADGSHTLYVPEMDEHYHSVNGAIQESTHVFLNAGFRQTDADPLHVLEYGFGTGLNAWLTLLETLRTGRKVVYTTIEKYPLSAEMAGQLNYGRLLDEDRAALFDRLHEAPWNRPVEITDCFTLCKLQADYRDCPIPDVIDLVYYDAFAPDKQPEVWSQTIFDRISNSLVPGGIMVTYCAKGAVRRMWKSAGLQVERLPGPPGKREMLRGVKKR